MTPATTIKVAPARVTPTAIQGVPLAMNQLNPPNKTQTKPKPAVFLVGIVLWNSGWLARGAPVVRGGGSGGAPGR